jgi:FlaA1/EpsC-like NDP-sugar epimerase
LNIREAIIAMPSAPAKRVGEIVHILRRGGLACRTLPSLDQLANGQVRVSQLRNVEVQDLLGRERVELETENIGQLLRGRVVLVTGAGGSIGSELCRQIAGYQPERLLLIERSEPQAFQIEQELIRPGEKLFEELSHEKENFVPTAHRKIFRVISEPLRLDDARRRLQSLREQLHSKPANALKLLLHDCVPDYSPWLGGDLADLPVQPRPEPKRAPTSDQPLAAAPSFSVG